MFPGYKHIAEGQKITKFFFSTSVVVVIVS